MEYVTWNIVTKIATSYRELLPIAHNAEVGNIHISVTPPPQLQYNQFTSPYRLRFCRSGTAPERNQTFFEHSMGSSIDKSPPLAISPKRTTLRPTRSSIFKRRISKACDECRRRKAKCDGRTLCTPCTERGLYCCFYREKTRDRTSQRSRTVDPLETGIQYRDSSLVHTKPPGMIEHTSSHPFSRIYQIHYGASSNISFINHLYRSFDSLLGGNRPIRPLNDFSKTLGQVGAENLEITTTPDTCNKVVLLEDDLSLYLAIEILEHFLALHQVLIPILCPHALRSDLCAFYDQGSSYALSDFRQRTLLLVLATASLTTKHHKVVDRLMAQFYKLTGPSDDNLTLDSIEVDCLLISSTYPSLRCH